MFDFVRCNHWLLVTIIIMKYYHTWFSSDNVQSIDQRMCKISDINDWQCCKCVAAGVWWRLWTSCQLRLVPACQWRKAERRLWWWSRAWSDLITHATISGLPLGLDQEWLQIRSPTAHPPHPSYTLSCPHGWVLLQGSILCILQEKHRSSSIIFTLKHLLEYS